MFNFSLAFSSECECQLRRMLIEYTKELSQSNSSSCRRRDQIRVSLYERSSWVAVVTSCNRTFLGVSFVGTVLSGLGDLWNCRSWVLVVLFMWPWICELSSVLLIQIVLRTRRRGDIECNFNIAPEIATGFFYIHYVIYVVSFHFSFVIVTLFR